VSAAVRAPEVTLTIWRAGKEMSVPLKTVALSGRDVDRVLIWAGATLQAPHRAIAVQRGHRAQRGLHRFLHVWLPRPRATSSGPAGESPRWTAFPSPTSTLSSARSPGRPDDASLRLKTESWNGQVEIITLRLDQHYWPAYELRRTETGWKRLPLE
jgi:hypothetical protein